jgi:hypothetical protein
MKKEAPFFLVPAPPDEPKRLPAGEAGEWGLRSGGGGPGQDLFGRFSFLFSSCEPELSLENVGTEPRRGRAVAGSFRV